MGLQQNKKIRRKTKKENCPTADEKLDSPLTTLANHNTKNPDNLYIPAKKQNSSAEKKGHKAQGPTENRVRKPPHKEQIILSTV